MKRYTKKEYINAVVWLFGFTKKAAADYIKNAGTSTLNEIVAAFYDNAKRCMFTD